MRILFVTATRIGDAVLSTSLLSYLIDRYPGARFTIAAGPIAAPLFEAVPGLERLIVVAKQKMSRHWLKLWGQVVGRHWDLVIDLRGSALVYLLWARERRVMAKGDPSEHRVQQLARLYALDPPPAPHLWTGPEHEARAAALLPKGAPVLVIGPAANWRGKQWRAVRFAELATRLIAREPFRHSHVVVMAAEHERPQALPLLDVLPPERRIDLVGKIDLLTAAAILRRSQLFIGNDTGLMHVAAASGALTLGLFGPGLPAQYGPWGPNAAIVFTEIPGHELLGTPGFDHRTTDTLMDSLSVDAVEEAALKLFHRGLSR